MKNKVADFCSAKYNISFEERDELLMDHGEIYAVEVLLMSNS
ncbi:hypothetical protein O5821_04465 [Escherichia coli]|nr:hypothetical protein [Escherichia coli]